MMNQCMLDHHPVLKAGDAFLHNSPYHGCSHPADHTVLVPIVDAQGVHRFTALAKAHLTERYLQAAYEAAEIFGGIGATWEGDVQIWLKRAIFDRAFLGMPAVHRERAAQLAGW